jgi:hypothetical protein
LTGLAWRWAGHVSIGTGPDESMPAAAPGPQRHALKFEIALGAPSYRLRIAVDIHYGGASTLHFRIYGVERASRKK